MEISIIAAISKNDVIGICNNLPWHLPADLAHFKRLTLNKVIIMGRKTYESIGHPLSKRTNIIISNNSHYSVPNCQVFTSLQEAVDSVQVEEVMVIGGASLYKQALPMATQLHLTFVDVACEGDTFFPKIDWNDWKEISREDHLADKSNLYNYSFVTLKRC